MPVGGPPSGPLPTFHRKQVPEDDVSPGTSGLKRKNRQNGLGCGTCRPHDSKEARSSRHAAQQPLMVLTISRGTEYGQALHHTTSELKQSLSAARHNLGGKLMRQTSLMDLSQPDAMSGGSHSRDDIASLLIFILFLVADLRIQVQRPRIDTMSIT